MTPSSVLSAGSVPDTVLENCRAAEARSWWLTGISGAEAAAGACPAQAEAPLANAVPLSRTAANELRLIYFITPLVHSQWAWRSGLAPLSTDPLAGRGLRPKAAKAARAPTALPRSPAADRQ